MSKHEKNRMGENQTEDNLIGNTSQLRDSGAGLRFDIKDKVRGEVAPAFAIQYQGQFYAYLNRCGHIAVQLDYLPGEFFSDDGETLVCSTHGAEYAPQTGACLGGPCYGVGLEPLEVEQLDQDLLLVSDRYQVVKAPK